MPAVHVAVPSDLPPVDADAQRVGHVLANLADNARKYGGEKKVAAEVKNEQYHHVERRYGTFSRSFSLPQTVDPSRVSAEYRNGVLSVKLPLRDEAKPRSIKVDVAA